MTLGKLTKKSGESIQELYPHLIREKASINKKGKPTGKYEIMLTEDGLATNNTGERNKVKKHALRILELLAKKGCHFVLQASEGDGIKVVGTDGMTRAIVLYRSGNMQTFNLKADKEEARKILTQTGFDGKAPETTVNIRSNSKSDYTYTDFPEGVKTSMVASFILNLPPSSHCSCGHANDQKKTVKTIKKATKNGVIVKDETTIKKIPTDKAVEESAVEHMKIKKVITGVKVEKAKEVHQAPKTHAA